MTKYVALLRGINVGGNKKVEMSKLRKIFGDLGFQNVSTYINSGNVIFETDSKKDLDKLIEKSLLKFFGFEIKVIIRDSKNIQKICKHAESYLKNNKEQITNILFLWDKYNNKKSLGLVKTTEVDNLKYVHGTIIWNVSKKNHKKSGLEKFASTELYKHMTARNVNTVRKLNDLLQKM